MASFQVLLPPGWSRVDLVEGVDEALDRFVGSVARQAAPSRQPTVRRLLTEDVVPRLRDFASQGVACLLMPTAVGYREAVRPVVSFTPIPSKGDVDPMLVLQALVGEDPTAELVDVEGLVAVRVHTTADATQAAQAAQPVLDAVVSDASVPKIKVRPEAFDVPKDVRLVSKRVRYTLGDPEDREKWMTVQMAVDHFTTPDSERAADNAVDVFDTIISTFRWDS